MKVTDALSETEAKISLIEGFDVVIIQRGRTHKRSHLYTTNFDIVEQILRTNEWAIVEPLTDKLEDIEDTVICLLVYGTNTAEVIAILQQIFPNLTFE